MARSPLQIHVYGDSLSLPRPAEGIHPSDTYPELLRAALEAVRPDGRVELYNRSRGGVPIGDLYQQFVDDAPPPDAGAVALLVIQCGVVDCAPRPVPTWLRDIIGRLPVPLRWLVVKVLHFLRPFLLRAGLSWIATDSHGFSAALTNWLREAHPRFSRIYLINIAPTLPGIDSHSPGFTRSIAAYNELIARCAVKVAPETITVIDVHGAISEAAGGAERHINPRDGHHITIDGHRLYARLIADAEARRGGR